MRRFSVVLLSVLAVGLALLVRAVRNKPSLRDSIGSAAPSMEVFTASGRVDLRSLIREQTTVVVYSPTCPHCERQLNAIAKTPPPANVAVVLIRVVADSQSVDTSSFVTLAPRVYSVGARASRVASDLKVSLVPTSYVFDASKIVRRAYAGATRTDSLYQPIAVVK
jgi:hypothetical protein